MEFLLQVSEGMTWKEYGLHESEASFFSATVLMLLEYLKAVTIWPKEELVSPSGPLRVPRRAAILYVSCS